MSRSHLHGILSKGRLVTFFDIMDLISKLESIKEPVNVYSSESEDHYINQGIDASISTVLEFFGLEVVDGKLLPIVCNDLIEL